MFFFLLTLYFPFVASNFDWYEYYDDGIIGYYDTQRSGNSRTDWTIYADSYGISDYFTFQQNCCSHDNVVLLFDRPDSWSKIIKFHSNDMSINSFQIINTNKQQQQQLNTEYMKNNISFYFGCFNESTYYYYYDDKNYQCRQSITSATVINIYNSSCILFGDNVNQYFELYYEEITTNKPFIYLDGLNNQDVYVNLDFSTNNVDFKSEIYYLFTSGESVIYQGTSFDSGSCELIKFCSRFHLSRYGIVSENLSIPDCSCWSKNNDKFMNKSTLFNYPDCNYNSSMFDLILPTNSLTYSLSNDLLEWYSIQFTTSNQSIEINYEQTLIIDELNINQEDISFNGNVYINYLTITTSGTSFNVLNFDAINYVTTDINEVLFTTKLTSTNLESFGLIQIGNDVMIGFCIYDGFGYSNKSNVEMDECLSSKNNNSINYYLLLESTEYIITSNEYWNVLEITEDNLILNGTATISSNVCKFEDTTITINCNLYCETMNINSNTKLIVNGELSINKLVITDEIYDNLNENGVIESFGLIELLAVEMTEKQSNCFELISSNDSLSQISISSGYSTLLLSQSHLLRICRSLNTNYEVQCTTIGNTFEQESFDLLHCPCVDSNCTINVNTTQLDTRNVEFDGLFNILTNSTIAISYKTSSFSIEYEDDDKQILLIENGAVGFETSLNTNSLESETTTLSIQSSNQLPCKALLIQCNNQQCIIEDNTTYPDVEDIDNCQLQNGFGCEICYEGYESNVTYCNECSSNCLRCYNNECINCEMNYQLNETNQCELISDPIISFDNNKTMKCNNGYYSNTNQCIKCLDGNCITCNSSECLTCNNSFILNNGNCQSNELNNGEIISNYGVIDCNDGYYSNNSQCIDCSLTFDNCELCNINGCLSCSNGVIINNGSCSLNTNCLNISDSICLNCDDKGSWFNGNECIKCGNECKNCINGYCIECNDGYILQSDNNCIKNDYPDNCITLNYYGTCQRCSDGYYLNNNLCYECSNKCSKCYNTTYCFECNDGYMLNSNNECVDMSEVNSNCKIAIPGGSGGCAICNDGYYRNQTYCLQCISNCTKCYNGESCISCESDYFLLNDASKCISYDDLTNCETKTQSGCTKCNDTYYLNNQYCISCSHTTDNCNTCNNNEECLTCQNDYVLVNYECINYQLIDNCKESNDSKCTSCSFWHTLNSDQTGCDKQVVWWVIVLIGIVLLIMLIGICVLILYVIKLLLTWRKQQKQRKETTIFDMKTSNVQFMSTNNKDIVINKNEILFDDECEEIGVNEETRDLLCVGNTSKHIIKVQFSVKDGCDKYEIRTNPQLITIPKGKAVEFEIFIKPLCTCKINDQIMLISVDLSKGKTITTPITINTITIMTSRLDYAELEESNKLGEGSFGIVYKGTFRGNQVAIKKLKEFSNNDKLMKEFIKEVSMLDKFRNEYVIHFYGAVFIPTKICMVTEFAQYGSLQDLINNGDRNFLKDSLKMKILLDAAKGIQYLHSNGILHRDIKPDNFLILSLDSNVKVNSKLTDFGSSRNINMMMTNMTFTKGVGTPTYMAPEILMREKYKKSADIYSFSIAIYETIIWGDAYSSGNEKFKFPWKIANFVTNGKRLPKSDTMNESIYSLITNCWCQDPRSRYEINQIITKLEEIN